MAKDPLNIQLGASAKTYRSELNLYILFIGLVTVAVGLLALHDSRSWTISDWLINYQGGFVRRGLPGEVAYLLGRLFHLSPVFFVALMWLALYSTLLLSIRSLALHSTRNVWIAALLLSPATLSFQILDVQAGFHKELLYLAAFSLFVALLSISSSPPSSSLLTYASRSQPPYFLTSP